MWHPWNSTLDLGSNPSWGDALGLDWLKEGEFTTRSGYPFGYNVNPR
jgi:hypothetical protein